MTSQNLYNKLKNAYTETNLNRISSHIITLYRNKNFESVLKLGKLLKDFIRYDISKVNRLFNQLMMLYHPDKLSYYNNMLEKYQEQKDQEKLNQFTHIFIIDEALKKKPAHDNFDYNELYYSQVAYEIDEEDFDTISHSNSLFSESENDIIENPDNDLTNFIMVVQQKEKIDFNTNSMEFYLEQLAGELDVSNSNIYDLDGIEYCKNITSIDLSHNQIIDITKIGDLVFLESIYLSNNNISDIAALAELKNLKYIDLSFNDINDIGPLGGLDNLEYLNVIGNDIPKEQLEEFRKYAFFLIY